MRRQHSSRECRPSFIFRLSSGVHYSPGAAPWGVSSRLLNIEPFPPPSDFTDSSRNHTQHYEPRSAESTVSTSSSPIIQPITQSSLHLGLSPSPPAQHRHTHTHTLQEQPTFDNPPPQSHHARTKQDGKRKSPPSRSNTHIYTDILAPTHRHCPVSAARTVPSAGWKFGCSRAASVSTAAHLASVVGVWL